MKTIKSLAELQIGLDVTHPLIMMIWKNLQMHFKKQ